MGRIQKAKSERTIRKNTSERNIRKNKSERKIRTKRIRKIRKKIQKEIIIRKSERIDRIEKQ